MNVDVEVHGVRKVEIEIFRKLKLHSWVFPPLFHTLNPVPPPTMYASLCFITQIHFNILYDEQLHAGYNNFAI